MHAHKLPENDGGNLTRNRLMSAIMLFKCAVHCEFSCSDQNDRAKWKWSRFGARSRGWSRNHALVEGFSHALRHGQPRLLVPNRDLCLLPHIIWNNQCSIVSIQIYDKVGSVANTVPSLQFYFGVSGVSENEVANINGVTIVEDG